MTERLLKIAEVKERTGLSNSTIYKWMKNGVFPQNVNVGQSAFWPESEINEWIQSLKEKRDAKHCQANRTTAAS